MKWPSFVNASRDLRKTQTLAERILWDKLRNRKYKGYKFLRQHAIHYPVGHGMTHFYIADFYCKELKIVLELDGESHLGREEYDQERDLFMKELGLKVIRIYNEVAIQDPASILALLAPTTP